ncbi:MAG: ThuA domain-containing protein, partial [Candidatus Firestonebacteria bacterium]
MKLKTAVVTGHHSYDVVNFHKLWNSFEGLEPYIQHIEDFCSSPDVVRDAYDCVVFYMMPVIEIKDEMPWFWGKPKSALERLGVSKQGLVMLHHTTWAYGKWDFWNELLGMPGRTIKKEGFHFDQKVGVKISDKSHPITRGLKDWEMTDETYELSEPGG